MSRKTQQRRTTPKPGSRLAGIRRITDQFQAKAVDKDATVSDYVRLVSLEREFRDEEEIKEVRVTWLRPSETESGT